ARRRRSGRAPRDEARGTSHGGGEHGGGARRAADQDDHDGDRGRRGEPRRGQPAAEAQAPARARLDLAALHRLDPAAQSERRGDGFRGRRDRQHPGALPLVRTGELAVGGKAPLDVGSAVVVELPVRERREIGLFGLGQGSWFRHGSPQTLRRRNRVGYSHRYAEPVQREALLSATVHPGGREPAPGGLALVQSLVNTVDREHGPDLFDDVAGLRDWLDARGLLEPAAPITGHDLEHARDTREALRSLLLANNGEPDDPAARLTLEAAAARADL